MNAINDHIWCSSLSKNISINWQTRLILVSLLITTAIGDLLFWRNAPGISLGIYSCLLMATIMINRAHVLNARESIIYLGLASGAAVQSAIALSLSNTIVWCLLLTTLSGHTFYHSLNPIWGRWVEALIATRKLFSNWISLVTESKAIAKTGHGDFLNQIKKVITILFPACLLFILFSALLAGGNAIFGDLLNSLSDRVGDLLNTLSFPSVGRMVQWAILASITLVLIRLPVTTSTASWWSLTIPHFKLVEDKKVITWWQSFTALLTVNLLFFLSNSLDVLFLWSSKTLPAGVTYTEYVHQGVSGLIFAVILAALILTLVFQQHPSIAGSKWIKALGLLWILQNLFLVSGVFLRLELYVDSHWMTPKRVYVAFFLILVCAGFILLAWHVFKNKGLVWLISRNIFLVFCLFYTIQFLNVRAWVAQYNLVLWKAEPERDLGMDYFSGLGAEAWPVMLAMAQSGQSNQAVTTAYNTLQQQYQAETAKAEIETWPSWQWRKETLRHELFTTFPTIKKAEQNAH